MQNKYNSILGMFLLLIGFSSTSSYAQIMGTSPYSGFGIGEISDADNASFQALGGAKISIADSNVLNYYNPASYANIAKGQPLFVTGLNATYSRFTSPTDQYSANALQINHFILGIPVSKNFGFAFGLKPFTRTGYEFSEKAMIGTELVNYTYKGSGSSNDLFAGISVNVVDYKGHRLGLGGNFSYLFGGNLNQRQVRNTSNVAGGSEEISYKFASFKYELGLSYQYKISREKDLNFGMTYQGKQDLDAKRSDILYFGSNMSNENSFLVVDALENIKGTVTIPESIGFGLGYTFKPVPNAFKARKHTYEMRVFADYKSTDWTQYAERFGDYSSDLAMQKTNQYSLGFQYAPHYDILDRSTGVKFYNRIRYRVGVQSTSLPVLIDHSSVVNNSVSIGLGIPIVTQFSTSSLNISATTGVKDGNSDLIIKEQFWSFNIGVSIAPGRNDRWFRRFKID